MELENDLINLMIVIFGYQNSKYIKVDNGDIHIVNKKIQKCIIKLGGSKIYKDQNFNGSDQHKGIKKMIYHWSVVEEIKINITGHEIKSLFKTRKRSKDSKNYIFCTYNAYFILMGLTKLLEKHYYDYYYEFLPEYYAAIIQYYNGMQNQANVNLIPFKNEAKIDAVISELQLKI